MPNSKDLNGSLFDTVTAHTEALNDHGTMLDDHGIRIVKLEKADREQAQSIDLLTQKFAEISTNFTRMENTILKSAQSTQEVMSTQNAQQWELIKALNAGNQDDRARKHEITKTKMELFWEYAGKVTLALVGSGGFFYVLLEAFAK